MKHDRDSVAEGLRRVEDFTPSSLAFAWDGGRGGFRHNYDRDLHLFAVWSTARHHEAAILDKIAADFRILATFEISWTAEFVDANFSRLYGGSDGGGAGKVDDAGSGPFLVVIVEDESPIYRYRQNVSGDVELTSTRVAEVKRAARALAGGYSVHSSNNLREFFRDATLLLGPGRLDAVLARPVGEAILHEEIRADLVGTGGWDSFEELTSVLHRSVSYVVLRNHEDLPAVDDDREVDVLARHQVDFASIVNGERIHPHAGAGFRSHVGSEEVIFDVRWIGDGYLDARWQDELLARCEWLDNGFAVPRIDDRFFSLLYHAKVQKPQVKPSYLPRLRELALSLGLEHDLAGRVTEDEPAAAILDGFLAAHGYTLPRPEDVHVHRNDAFIARLARARVEPDALDVVKERIYRTLRRSRIGERAARSDSLRVVARTLRARFRLGTVHP